MKEEDIVEGEVKEKITHDFILKLYEEIKEKDISEEEVKGRIAVLKVFADHIGEYLVLKYNKQPKEINE